MKKIALVGSTGSIGRQVIDVVSRSPRAFEIAALIACRPSSLFFEQVSRIKPAYAALADGGAADFIKELPENIAAFCGEEGAVKALKESGADIAFIACSGFAGLKYSLAAIECGMTLALANKETLVCGGEVVMPRVKDIIPVDSEHSAIWQCLSFNRSAQFESLVITASGGPFRGRSYKSLSSVTPEQALNHPTWKMGAKITVDSATLLNKGYEVIEAHYLYGAPYGKIETVIHPQSVVHSMVRFQDGALMAQLSCPTMELPISLALTYPERIETGVKKLSFDEALSLEFLPLVRADYPLYDLALRCGEAGGVLPAALNAASEAAVKAFLQGRIRFTDIYAVADRVAGATKNERADSYAVLAEADKKAARLANKIIEEI